MSFYRLIIPKIAAVLTGSDRQIITAGKDFQWASKLWTHNVFRVFEVIFGRKVGIRAETSVIAYAGTVIRAAHSFEGAVALLEQSVRDYFAGLVPVKVWIPVLHVRLAGGGTMPLFASPYLFAIAWDTAVDNNYSGVSPATWNHTMTGSNLFAAVSCLEAVNATNTITAFTWNTSETVSNVSGASIRLPLDRFQAVYQITGPTSGTHGFSVSFTGGTSPIMFTTSSSYSGCAQSGQPDQTNSGTTGTAGSVSPTLAINTTANKWVIGVAGNNNRNITSVSGCTARTATLGSTNLVDSNGTVSISATTTFTLNAADATGSWGWGMMSIVPFVAPATVSASLLSMMGVG
jgi:hypothetical protein